MMRPHTRTVIDQLLPRARVFRLTGRSAFACKKPGSRNSYKADIPAVSDDALRGGLERARQLLGNTLHGAGADTDFAGDLQDALTGS